MNKDKDYAFKQKVVLKMVAAGMFENMTVTWKSGTFTYLLPMWIHYTHLKLLVAFSGKWCDTVVELLNNPTNKK